MKGGERSRSRFSGALQPMVNLTIKNERKKITAIAFVPDSIVFRDFVVTRRPLHHEGSVVSDKH